MGIDINTLAAAKNYVDETLTGAGGLKGEDGFSPVVAVKESSDTVYKLEITTAATKFETPNLMASVTVEDTLSADSVNPVQNKAVYAALANKANTADIPTSLPANGGNADTLDGLDSTNFVQQHLVATSADLVNNANLRYSYETVIATDVASLVGLPSAWWHLKYMRHGYEGGYGFQMAFPLDSPNAPPMYRMALGTTWQNWQALFTTRYMPYVTGTASISYNSENGGVHELEVLDFTPSFVICRHTQDYNSNGVLVPAISITNGFKITVAQTTVKSVDYIAFR